MNPSKNDWVDANSDQREWAHETLGLPTGVSGAEMPILILKRLARQDFIPGRDWHAAIEFLLPRESPTNGAVPLSYYYERESEVREKVEQFANTYFDLAPAERRVQWDHLHPLSLPWPPLRLWLERLQPGLDITLPTVPQSTTAVCRLAEFLGHQFRQRPGQVDARTWELRNSTFQDKKRWQPVARKFQRQFPDQARVFAPWVQEFAEHSTTTRRIWRERLWSILTLKANPQNDLSKFDLTRYFNLPVCFVVAISVSAIAGFYSAEWNHPGNRSVPLIPPKYIANEKWAREAIHELLNPMSAREPADIAEIRKLGKRAARIEIDRMRDYDQRKASGIGMFRDEISRIIRLGDQANTFEILTLAKYRDQVNATRPKIDKPALVENIRAWHYAEPLIAGSMRPLPPVETVLRRIDLTYLKFIPRLSVHAILRDVASTHPWESWSQAVIESLPLAKNAVRRLFRLADLTGKSVPQADPVLVPSK